MKKLAAMVLVVCMLLSTSVCLADEYDLPNMTRAELNALRNAIDTELDANHKATSSQTTKVDDAFKKSVHDYYGEDNVFWAWIDYSYGRDWDYFTIATHADIKKHDGGKARYDLVGAVYVIDNVYQTVYVKVGNEIIFDIREEVITDARIRAMLGYDIADATADLVKEEIEQPSSSTTTAPDISTPTSEPTEAPKEEKQETVPEISYKNGDRGDEVKAIQERLIQLGYLTGSADGAFGRMTEDAVKRFQRESGLTVTGIVDVETYKALYKANAPVAPTPTPAPIQYTAVQLYNKFDANEVAANAELKGKTFNVSGKVYSIEEDSGWFSDGYVVRLYADSYGFCYVYCYFDETHGRELAKLSKGTSIVVSGTCDGADIFGYPEMKDCEIVG